jgi:hypothetical protein
VRVLKTILLVGGLGVKDKQNGLGEVPILIRALSFSGVGTNKKSANHGQEQFMNRNNKFEIILLLLNFTPYGTALSLYFEGCTQILLNGL